MKMSFNIDEVLLERVMTLTGASTKTEAIHMALREVDRRARLVEVLNEGLGCNPEELRKLFDENSDPMLMRVAEPRSKYGSSSDEDDDS